MDLKYSTDLTKPDMRRLGQKELSNINHEELGQQLDMMQA
jgi:hypothetical protein